MKILLNKNKQIIKVGEKAYSSALMCVGKEMTQKAGMWPTKIICAVGLGWPLLLSLSF